MNRATSLGFPGYSDMPDGPLKHRRVLITGWARGVGRETAIRLLAGQTRR
jgi:hypothetical protein